MQSNKDMTPFRHQPLSKAEFGWHLLFRAGLVAVAAGVFFFVLKDKTGWKVESCLLWSGLLVYSIWAIFRFVFGFRFSLRAIKPSHYKLMAEMAEDHADFKHELDRWHQERLTIRDHDYWVFTKCWEQRFKLRLKTDHKLRDVMDTLDAMSESKGKDEYRKKF